VARESRKGGGLSKHVLGGLLGLILSIGCTRSEPPKDAPAKPAATASVAPAATVSATASGAPGAGDKSGNPIANARPLLPGSPSTFTVPCSGQKLYVGPFSMKRDPERLVVRASVKSNSGVQVCATEGHWVDAKGQSPSVAGLPCAEGTKPVEAKLEYEYSPGNGGNAVNPVYWEVVHPSPKASCETVTVTLSMP